VVACGGGATAAALWAIAQVLQWPVWTRVVLAAAAALATVLIPELRARAARTDLHERLLDRLEVRGARGALPRVSEVEASRLRVHSAQAEVPYIVRDAEADLYDALRAGRPAAVVGHSMAGKTALAWHCVQAAFQNAELVAPIPGKPLRELAEAGLELNGVVVWLDDLELPQGRRRS
jgi:hypothetical protein